MKKKKILIAALVLLVIIGGSFGSYRYLHNNDENGNHLLLYGNVDIRQIELAFHATGRIQEMLVQEGAAVKAGQLVARIDPSRYIAAKDKAKAQLAAQKEVLARLVAGSRPEEITAAQSRVAAAEAEFADAEANFQRLKELVKNNAVPRQQFDNAQAVYLSARANLSEARQNLILARKGPRDEDIAAARAQLQADEAALTLAEQELHDTKLYAPSDGIIQDRILEPGDMAFPQTPVFTVALDNPIWVRAYVSETDLGKIIPGMGVVVQTDSFPDKSYKGWVGFISPTAEFTPKQVETIELRSRLVYRLRINVCNPQNELRLGMPVSIIIPLPQQTAAAAGATANPCEEQ